MNRLSRSTILTLVACLLLFRPMAWSQTAPHRAAGLSPEPSADVGVVYAGTKLVHQFPLMNAGPSKIVIHSVHASCGCLAPKLSKDTLQPGDNANVSIEINTLSQAAGPHTWTVDLEWNDGADTHKQRLELKGQLIAEISVQPAAMVVIWNKTAGHEIVISDNRADPCHVTQTAFSTDHVRARVVPKPEAAGKHRPQRISIEVESGLPDGRHEEWLSIFTDDSKYAEMRVPITIIKYQAQQFTATPNDVTLLAAKGSFPSRIVLVRDSSDRPVQVVSATSDHPGIHCKWATGPKNLATLRITADKDLAQSPAVDASIRVRFVGQAEKSLTIPVRCRQSNQEGK